MLCGWFVIIGSHTPPLFSVNRSRTPWVIVATHRPLYNSEQYQSDFDVSIGMRKEFEILLRRYQVRTYLRFFKRM